MAYGAVPHHEQHPHHSPWRDTFVALVVVGALVLVGLSIAGWVQATQRDFDRRADTTLCSLLKDGC